MEKIYKWLIDNKPKLIIEIYKLINNKANAEDFYQDLVIMVAEKNINLLTKLHDNDELWPFVFMIIKNNLYSKTSRYYYKYTKDAKQTIMYVDEADKRIETMPFELSELYDELNYDVSQLNKKIRLWLEKTLPNTAVGNYHKQIFLKYYYDEDTTIRSLGEEIDAPPTSIFNSITKIKVRLMKEFKTDILNIKEKIIYINTYDNY